MGPEEHVWSNIFESSLKTFQFSGLLLKFPWQQLKINFRVEKTAKNVSRSKPRKILFRKKNVTVLFFSPSWAKFFLYFWTFTEKLPAWLSKLQPAYLSKILRFNNFLKNCTVYQPSSEFEIKKLGPLVEKIFSGFL